MRIGFTGTQVGMSENQRHELYKILYDNSRTERIEFHHGDCIGADAQAHDIAETLGCYIIVHPPAILQKRAWKIGNEILPERAYLTRNQMIVDACDLLIAAPKTHTEEIRSGTWATIRYARKSLVSVYILNPWI